MRLYLVRHGQTSWNNDGRAQGHTDVSLDPVGLAQAHSLAESFRSRPPNRILTSDLARSTETAIPIGAACHVPVERRADLRERSFGEWEGLQFTEVAVQIRRRAEELNVSPQLVRPPGGESFEDVWNRLDPIYRELCEINDDVIVVSHGGALSLLLAKLIRGTLDTSRAFRFPNTGVTELERRPEGLFLIVKYGDTTHLASDRVLSGSLDGVTR